VVLFVVMDEFDGEERFSVGFAILLRARVVCSCISTGIGLAATWKLPLLIGIKYFSKFVVLNTLANKGG